MSDFQSYYLGFPKVIDIRNTSTLLLRKSQSYYLQHRKATTSDFQKLLPAKSPKLLPRIVKSYYLRNLPSYYLGLSKVTTCEIAKLLPAKSPKLLPRIVKSYYLRNRQVTTCEISKLRPRIFQSYYLRNLQVTTAEVPKLLPAKSPSYHLGFPKLPPAQTSQNYYWGSLQATTCNV
jgi:hypothetical protein